MEDTCSQIYLGWTVLANVDGKILDNHKHETVCSEWIERVINFFDGQVIWERTYQECIDLLVSGYDYNNDGHMNFREFIGFAYAVFYDVFLSPKLKQINCSACIDIEHYNPRYDTDTERNLTAVLAAEEVCWSASDWSIGTDHAFNAPLDGILAGVRLVWKSGGVTCHAGVRKTYFGCFTTDLGVQMVKITDPRTFYGETIYPWIEENGTMYAHSADYCLDSTDSHGCEYEDYKMSPYFLPIEPILEWIEPQYEVHTDMKFMLADGQACCEYHTYNNDGTSCVEVWFLYDGEQFNNTNIASDISTTATNVAIWNVDTWSVVYFVFVLVIVII